MLAHTLSRTNPSTALKEICLFTHFSPIGHISPLGIPSPPLGVERASARASIMTDTLYQGRGEDPGLQRMAVLLQRAV